MCSRETHAVLAGEFPQPGDELHAVAASRVHDGHVRPIEVLQYMYYRPRLVAVGRREAHEIREARLVAQQVAGRRRTNLRYRELTENIGDHRRRLTAVGADHGDDVIGADRMHDLGAAAGVPTAEWQERQRPCQRYFRRRAIVDRDEAEARIWK